MAVGHVLWPDPPSRAQRPQGPTRQARSEEESHALQRRHGGAHGRPPTPARHRLPFKTFSFRGSRPGHAWETGESCPSRLSTFLLHVKKKNNLIPSRHLALSFLLPGKSLLCAFLKHPDIPPRANRWVASFQFLSKRLPVLALTNECLRAAEQMPTPPLRLSAPLPVNGRGPPALAEVFRQSRCIPRGFKGASSSAAQASACSVFQRVRCESCLVH